MLSLHALVLIFFCWCNNDEFHQSYGLKIRYLHYRGNEYQKWTLPSETRKKIFLFRYFSKKIITVEIQLSRLESLDSIKWFNPATILCMSQARDGLQRHLSMSFCFQLIWGVIVHFVDIDEMDEHSWLNFLFIVQLVVLSKYDMFISML